MPIARDKSLEDSASPQSNAAEESGDIMDSDQAALARLIAGSGLDVSAQMTGKVNPRFASRLRRRLTRL